MSESDATMVSSSGDPVPDATMLTGAERFAQAEALVRRMSWWSAGAGVIPVPLLDLAAISGVQFKMVRDLALMYGVPFEAVRTKAIISALVGGLFPFNAAMGVGGLAGIWYKAIPGVGPFLGMVTMPMAAGAANYAIGRLFLEHFEGGGTLLDIDIEKMRARYAAAAKDAVPAKSAA